jgi:hypothetical protein
MTTVETSEEVANQPTYQARVRVAYDHPIGPVEKCEQRQTMPIGYAISIERPEIRVGRTVNLGSTPCRDQTRALDRRSCNLLRALGATEVTCTAKR